MTTDLTVSHDLATAGQMANGYAAANIFERYRARKADNTTKTQREALALFARYLGQAGVTVDGAALYNKPDAWRGVTWGLVEGFSLWMLQEGYAVGTVNGRLSAIKAYAKQAAKAGALDAAELAMIRNIAGYSRAEGKRVDERREVTRLGDKKAEPVSLTLAQLRQLKKQPNTPQGRRDRVLVTLLADHGLRCGELAILEVTAVNLETGMLGPFYRPKVDLWQTHKLTDDARRALKAYFDAGDAPALGKLLRASAGAQRLTGGGMSERAITERVRFLGSLAGIDGLSAHDLRHTWATLAARNGTPLDRLMDGGGWRSSAMPLRYIETAKIANEGVRLEV